MADQLTTPNDVWDQNLRTEALRLAIAFWADAECNEDEDLVRTADVLTTAEKFYIFLGNYETDDFCDFDGPVPEQTDEDDGETDTWCEICGTDPCRFPQSNKPLMGVGE
jgi:hypothetical protein